jgi:hypothetical protein
MAGRWLFMRLTEGSAISNAPTKLACCSFLIGWAGNRLRLARVQDSVAAVASWRWRDALFEGPFRQCLGRTKFAEPRSDRVVQFHPRSSSGYPAR